MRYSECFGTNRFCNRTGIAPMVAMVLLLCLPSTLSADNQDSSHAGNTSSPCQTQGTNSAAHHAAGDSQDEPGEKSSQGSRIVDLKPGDVRLFEQSSSVAGKLDRWLDLQAASIATLYLFVKNGSGVTTANQQQYQVAVRGRFKFDSKGRLSINTGLYTGANFIAGSNNTGLGLAGAQSNLYLKHLYLSVRPFEGVEAQYGALDVWHDESTSHHHCSLRPHETTLSSPNPRRVPTCSVSVRLNPEQNSIPNLLSAASPILSCDHPLLGSPVVLYRTVLATLYTAVSPHSISIGSASAATTSGFLLAA